MAENQAPNIPVLKPMVLDMYGKALVAMSQEFVENTRKLTELEHKAFGKKKFANELLKQSSALYNKIFSVYKSFEKDKELLQGEEECASIMFALYGDIGIMMLRNINIIKMQLGEKVEETEEFAQATQNAFLEFEGLYRKFEKMRKAFIRVDTIKSEETAKPSQQKEDEIPKSTILGPKDFETFAKRVNDELLYRYIIASEQEKKLKSKWLGRKKLANSILKEYAAVGADAAAVYAKLTRYIEFAQGDGKTYSQYIATLLLDFAAVAIKDVHRMQIYMGKQVNETEEFAQQAVKAAYEFARVYEDFLKLSKKYNIILKGME